MQFFEKKTLAMDDWETWPFKFGNRDIMRYPRFASRSLEVQGLNWERKFCFQIHHFDNESHVASKDELFDGKFISSAQDFNDERQVQAPQSNDYTWSVVSVVQNGKAWHNLAGRWAQGFFYGVRVKDYGDEGSSDIILRRDEE